VISLATPNPSHLKISDKTSSTKLENQTDGSFLELLNELKKKPEQESSKNLLAMVDPLFSPMNEDSNESIKLGEQGDHQEEQTETEQPTREDLISFISLLFKTDSGSNNPTLSQFEKELQNINPSKSTLARLEKELHKTSQQLETIPLEKMAKLLAEATIPVKEGISTPQLGQKAVEDSLKPKQTGNMPVPDFEFQPKFEGKEVIFQSVHPNGAGSVAGKSEQAPLPKVSVQQFFSEVIELVKNHASLKKASEFMEAKFSLTPEKLGEIDVKLSIHKGQVAAHFTAETLIGKETLESQISLLRTSLQQQGLQVDKIEITLGGQGLQHSFSQQEEKSRQDQSQQRFSKKKINIEEFYQSHSTIEEYKQSGIENTINILA
jgi:flagellar hook-length control protein FliK